jgi:RNA polymerase sigma factor (sigma-70 family)
MTSEPAGVMPMADESERAEAIRSALERDFAPIARAVGAMVRSLERGRDREWLRQRTEEVVAEAICRALERPGSYDLGRPAVAWIVGIARNVMKGEARVASGRPRRADLDASAWESVLGVIDPKAVVALDHLDVERMLSRLSPQHRKVIELRYLQGLTGNELIEALDVASAEAARGRVFRAVQALRDLFARDGSEVDQ